MSGDVMSVDIEFDAASLADLKRTVGPALYEKAVANLNKDAIHVADAAAKKATPGSGKGPTGIPRTGHARRSTMSDANRGVVEGRYPYVNWLDKGEDSRGRRMLSRPGGYQIRRQTREAVVAAIPALLDKCGREIAERWVK